MFLLIERGRGIEIPCFYFFFKCESMIYITIQPPHPNQLNININFKCKLQRNNILNYYVASLLSVPVRLTRVPTFSFTASIVTLWLGALYGGGEKRESVKNLCANYMATTTNSLNLKRALGNAIALLL